MPKRFFVTALALSAVLAGAGSTNVISAPVAADPLSALAWMAGDWSGVDKQGARNEERWMEPAGGMMLAVHRDVAAGGVEGGGKAVSFEFLRIEATPDGIVYFASPRGKPPTPFRMVEAPAQNGPSVVFENPDHAFPRRILYWLGPAGELHAKIEGTLGGKPASEEWTWKRRAGAGGTAGRVK